MNTPAAEFSGWRRRDFLKASAATFLGLTFSRFPAMAGPFTRDDFDQLVPTDKKLSPAWVKSLFARGEPEVLHGSELKYIGMPVGGIGAGQLYLGGDGRLWHWDIFNQHIGTGADHYAKPMMPTSPLAQSFSLRIGDRNRSLDQRGFADVSFRGEYPIGIVEYADASAPVAVRLEAWSPFIPLNPDDSSLPATILQYTMRNTSPSPIDTTLTGELENGVCLYHRQRPGIMRNHMVASENLTILACSAQPTPETDSPDSGHSDDVTPLEKLSDFGTLALALLDNTDATSGDQTAPFTAKLVGSLSRNLTLAPGEAKTVTFVLAWHFPNLSVREGFKDCGRYYATRFPSAQAVVEHVAQNLARLEAHTKLWRDTWYDSTLPFWFLDRTFLNASILATSTCYRFANGRFYGWEGVGCCAGTCGHVYHYAHAAARLFPQLERDTRERIDFGLAQQADGAIRFRGERNAIPAIDAQAGTILRALREHQMCADDQFLRRNWPKIKLATQWLIAKDENGDGLIESNQHNTLDTDWFGKIAWLSGLYLAALAAASQMADEISDRKFREECRQILSAGQKNLVGQLFDGEYFINQVDPRHLDAINSGTGCEIDQVLGQSWAFQVGLPRVLPEKATRAALKSLWRYNFTPDVGPYRQVNKPGRWYAMPGEAGLLMCTFPRNDWDFKRAAGKGRDVFVGYFNECMNGFEYQVAGHLLWEGLAMEGLAVARAVHDRYHASRRNPWNEIECGDHYARSMASYGVYLAAGGFEHHGPQQHIGFAPRLTPEHFKCAFTSAEGWGSFSQQMVGGSMKTEITLAWGRLTLKTIALKAMDTETMHLSVGGKSIAARVKLEGGKSLITLKRALTINSGQKLEIRLG